MSQKIVLQKYYRIPTQDLKKSIFERKIMLVHFNKKSNDKFQFYLDDLKDFGSNFDPLKPMECLDFTKEIKSVLEESKTGFHLSKSQKSSVSGLF